MDWDIEKTSLACAANGRAFAEEEEICSALYYESPHFIRKDFGAESWPQQDKSRMFSFWRTRLPKKDAPVRRFVDDEVILDFFHRLEGDQDPVKRNFRYVLALLLMRKKTLKFKEMRRGDGGEALVLHDRVKDCDYEVVDPHLSEEQIQQVTEEIGKVLNSRI